MKRKWHAAVLVLSGTLAACDRGPAPSAGRGDPFAPVPVGDPRKGFADGEAALRQGDPKKALGLFKEAIAADPRFVPAWLRYQEVMRLAGQTDALRAELRANHDRAPDDPLWLTLLGAADADGADERLQKAVKLAPDFAWAHYILAGRHFASGRFDEALRASDRALQLDVNNGLFHFMKGIALSKSERPDDAVAALRRAIELLPGDERPHVALAEVLLDAERTEEAVVELETALQLAPAAESPKLVLRGLRIHKGKLALRDFSEHAAREHWGAAAASAEEAAAGFAAVLAADPEDASALRFLSNAETACAAAWLGRATASSRDGKIEDALAHCDKAVAWLAKARGRKPAEEDAREYLAQAHLRLGAILLGAATELEDKGSAEAAAQYRRALAAFEACLELDPDNGTAAAKAEELRKKLEGK